MAPSNTSNRSAGSSLGSLVIQVSLVPHASIFLIISATWRSASSVMSAGHRFSDRWSECGVAFSDLWSECGVAFTDRWLKFGVVLRLCSNSSTIFIACSTSCSLWKSISRCTPSPPILSNNGLNSSSVTQQAMILLPPARILRYRSYHLGLPPCGSPTPGVHWMALSSLISSRASKWCMAPTPSRW